MKGRRKIDPITEHTIRESVRKAFEEEEQARDDDFAQRMNRLLGSMDDFTKGGGDGSGDTAS